MNKSEQFWKNLDRAIAKSGQYGIHYSQSLYFHDYKPEKNKEIADKINEYYLQIIEDRDKRGINRYITAMDCSGMSILIHRFLTQLNIPSMLIIGDMSIQGHPEYETTYQYLENELNNIRSSKIQYHVWVIVENFMIIDPTIRLKESEREDFLNKKTNSGVFISDIEKLPQEIEYIPYLLGEEFLHKTNPNPFI